MEKSKMTQVNHFQRSAEESDAVRMTLDAGGDARLLIALEAAARWDPDDDGAYPGVEYPREVAREMMRGAFIKGALLALRVIADDEVGGQSDG